MIDIQSTIDSVNMKEESVSEKNPENKFSEKMFEKNLRVFDTLYELRKKLKWIKGN